MLYVFINDIYIYIKVNIYIYTYVIVYVGYDILCHYYVIIIFLRLNKRDIFS